MRIHPDDAEAVSEVCEKLCRMDLPAERPADELDTFSSPSRAGERWDAEEYRVLIDEIRRGRSIEEIALAHGRARGGIISACNRLLPADRRTATHQNAPVALRRYLRENPDTVLEPPAPSPRSRRRRRRRDEPEPLPPPTITAVTSDVKLEPGDAAALVSDAISSLGSSPRDQTILRLRLGLDDEPHTLAEIAERFVVSAERIRQIQNAGLAKLVRVARYGDTPGAALASLLRLPPSLAIDESFADRMTDIVRADFEAPTPLSILFLLCTAGVATSTSKHVAHLARSMQENRRRLEIAQRRATAIEERTTATARRADDILARWKAHADWPSRTTPPPDRDMFHALRLREPEEGSGRFASRKLGRDVAYESQLELATFETLENAADVAWYQEQPLKIAYMWEGRRRVYYPDVLVATRSGRCLLIEVKPVTNMPLSLNRTKATAGRDYAHAQGWGWVTVDRERTMHDLETHDIPALARIAIAVELETHRQVGWHQVLRLREHSGVTPLDISAFIVQTGAHLTLEPRYRVTASRWTPVDPTPGKHDEHR